jgi:hypothetical protein
MLPRTDMDGRHIPHIHRLQQSCSPSLPELTLQEQQVFALPMVAFDKAGTFHPSCLMSADDLRVYAGKATLHTYVCKCLCLKTSILTPQLSIHLILTQQPLPRRLPAWAWEQHHPVSWAALLSGSRRHPQ